jgi:hypothetical protein
MTVLERFDYAKKLWTLVLPQIPFPPNSTIFGWLSVYSDSELEATVIRVPYRLTRWNSGDPTPEDVYRLISSQLRDARKAQRRQKDITDIRSFDGRVNVAQGREER